MIDWFIDWLIYWLTDWFIDFCCIFLQYFRYLQLVISEPKLNADETLKSFLTEEKVTVISNNLFLFSMHKLLEYTYKIAQRWSSVCEWLCQRYGVLWSEFLGSLPGTMPLELVSTKYIIFPNKFFLIFLVE